MPLGGGGNDRPRNVDDGVDLRIVHAQARGDVGQTFARLQVRDVIVEPHRLFDSASLLLRSRCASE